MSAHHRTGHASTSQQITMTQHSREESWATPGLIGTGLVDDRDRAERQREAAETAAHPSGRGEDRERAARPRDEGGRIGDVGKEQRKVAHTHTVCEGRINDGTWH